jgi:predicted aspartyl protease
MRPENVRQIAQGGMFLSFVLTVATSGFSQSPSMPRSGPSNEASAGNYEIPFQTYRDYLIVVQGSLGDTQRLNFIVDTGTDPSVIDSRAAEKLHMAGIVGKLAVHNRIVEVQQAVLPSVQIGALRAEFLPVLIQDLAFLQKGLGIRVDAVIGLDVLSLSNFSIDYTTKRIVFGAVPLSGSAAPFERTEFSLAVRMEVDGVSVHLLLDTGASGIFLFQGRISDRLPQLISLGERTSTNMGGGELRLKRVVLATTNLGKTDFGQQNAFVVEDQEDSSGDFDGLLGTSALGLKQIAFDFQRHTFSWKR